VMDKNFVKYFILGGFDGVDSINVVHYFPLRLSVKDFARKLSFKKLDEISHKALPFDLNEFKVARCLINFSNNFAPFSLFQDLLVYALVESRNPMRPWFLDISRTRIGHQSFCNPGYHHL